jgi:hypothetical protein
MAIQYSYPKALGINSTDLLFGSQTSGEYGVKNVTKNFQVGALADFIASTLPFQELTTTGVDGAATLVDGVLNIPTPSVYNPGYKMYTVLLTQIGSVLPAANPSKTVLHDTLGLWSIEFARTAVGTYTATISGHLSNFNSAWYALTDNRFSLADENYMVVNKTGSTVITIYTYKSGVLSDGVLLNTPFEVRIFD